MGNDTDLKLNMGSYPDSEKAGNAAASIPLPVAAAPPVDRRETRRRRFRKLFKHFIVFAIIYLCILHWAQVFKPQVEEEAEKWFVNPFALPPQWYSGHRGAQRQGWGHGRHGRPPPILNGKAAEELFLYVHSELFYRSMHSV